MPVSVRARQGRGSGRTDLLHEHGVLPHAQTVATGSDRASARADHRRSPRSREPADERLHGPEAYRDVMREHVDRLAGELKDVDQKLDTLGIATGGAPDEDDFLRAPLSPREADLFTKRDLLANALARIDTFLAERDQEWIVRYPDKPDASLELVPLSVATMARDLLFDAADLVFLSSAFLGHPSALADGFGLPASTIRMVRSSSPFPLDRRPIVYRPVGPLSHATQPSLEPQLFDQVAAILTDHPRDKGLIHVASYAAGERLVRHLALRAPAEHRRVIWADSAGVKTQSLEQHRTSPLPTVLLSPALREGVDLPDDYLRFQILTKMPYPDLGDPWTAARRQRDPRWYALETAKALVQAYGRSCRHALDHGTTYILDGQFTRFLTRYRPLLPSWFLDAAHAAVLEHKRTSR
ncbi:MAG: hypothetical protein DMD91_11535 [Candidatus Rokuibacteriota bacterium]|nr:MAG: hypothetical protein DMD91_11535 [Candidatus Rokubacteria bacterium]